MADENVQQDEALFIGLVTMLSNSALQHLGKLADPLTGKVEKNFEAARSTIDLIRMLKNKTRGNLMTDEEKFINGILTHLQLNYVEEGESLKKTEEAEGGKDASEG